MNSDDQHLPTYKEAVERIKRLSKRGVPLWENARIVLLDVPLNRAYVKRLLPWFMSLTREAKATLFIADYPKNSFTVPYRESAVLIHVKTPFGKGVYCPWMLVDDDTALIYGRETLGYPKKLGEFSFNEDGSSLRAAVKRRGAEVMAVEANIKKEEVKNPSPVFSNTAFNIRHSNQFFIFHPIWMFRPKEKILSYHHADIKLTLSPSEYDPICRMIEGEPQNGRVATLDIYSGNYLLPVGVASYRWFIHNHVLRYA